MIVFMGENVTKDAIKIVQIVYYVIFLENVHNALMKHISAKIALTSVIIVLDENVILMVHV